MKILIVANHNKNCYAPFIEEQVDALRKLGVDIDYFGVHGKGMLGYLSNLSLLKDKINEYGPNLIHAHYGLSGLLSNLQRQVPVITTYHGSDIHSGGKTLLLSKLSIRFSVFNIFVSDWLRKQAGFVGTKGCIIPCGVNTDVLRPIDRAEARQQLGWDTKGKYVLFSGAFDNEVKNSQLAKSAIARIPDAQLVELRGYSREQVNLAMNAANCLLMTSHREGSPQVVKEAMVCGTPVVSVDVGDVKEVTAGIEGCFIAQYDAYEIAHALKQTFAFQGKTKGHQRIIERGLSNELIAKRIMEIYTIVLNKR